MFIRILCFYLAFLPVWVYAQETKSKTIVSQLTAKGSNQSRQIHVRLPANFRTDKAYSVLYILAASDFYLGDIYVDSVNLVTQLERYEEIPSIIVVGIQSQDWYQNSINNPSQLNTFLTSELPQFMRQHYLLSTSTMLIGHSYAGAYLVNNLTALSNDYPVISAISPVFPSIDFIQKSVDKAQSSLIKKLTIYTEKANEFDLNILNRKLQDKNFPQSINQHIVDNVSHQSILIPALGSILKNQFNGFMLPTKSMLHLNTEQIIETIKQRAHKYDIPFKQSDVDASITSLAERLMNVEKFEKAFKFWSKSNSPHKHYFINRWAERYEAIGDFVSAQIIWREMAKQFPTSPFPVYQLKRLAHLQGKLSEAKIQQQKLQQLYPKITSTDKPMFSAFAKKLITDGEHSKGIDLLTLLAETQPDDKQGWENLVQGYKQIGREDKARAISRKHSL